MKFLRRDFIKGMVAVPFLGAFAAGAKSNISKQLEANSIDYNRRLNIDRINATSEKLTPPTGKNGKKIRIRNNGGGAGSQLIFAPEAEFSLEGNYFKGVVVAKNNNFSTSGLTLQFDSNLDES